jgi:hypothetical protein
MAGNSIYPTNSRLDISYAVGVASRFMSTSQEAYLKTVKYIFKYLKGTMVQRIYYRKGDENVIQGYLNSD